MADEARGVETNGIGQRTTAHLNLTRSLADVWGLTPLQVSQSLRHLGPREAPGRRFRYAGYEQKREKGK